MSNNFNMSEENITMVKGDTLSFGLDIEGLGGQDLDSAFFTCKEVPTSNTHIFKKSLGDGITKQSAGKYVIRVSPADTADAIAGMYWYDCRIGLNGDVFTIMHGVLELLQNVTEEESE